MPGMLRTNEDKTSSNDGEASAFAKLALSKVGGSCVYIEPKKTGRKLINTDPV